MQPEENNMRLELQRAHLELKTWKLKWKLCVEVSLNDLPSDLTFSATMLKMRLYLREMLFSQRN